MINGGRSGDLLMSETCPDSNLPNALSQLEQQQYYFHPSKENVLFFTHFLQRQGHLRNVKSVAGKIAKKSLLLWI